MKSGVITLAESFHLVHLDEENILLISEVQCVKLCSKIAIEVIRLLENASVHGEEIVMRLRALGHDLGEVMSVLSGLIDLGLVCEQSESELQQLGNAFGFHSAKLSGISRDLSVRITSVGKADPDCMVSTFEDAGFEVNSETGIQIVLTSDLLHPDLDKINHDALQAGEPWLLVKLSGASPIIGPLFQPQSTDSACWKCLAQRIELRRPEVEYLRQTLREESGLFSKTWPVIPMVENMACNFLVLEVLKLLHDGTHTVLEGGLFELNMSSGNIDRHIATKRPQCPACGDGNASCAPPKAIELDSDLKAVAGSNGWRICKPETTFETYEKHIGLVTGVVPFVRPKLIDHEYEIFVYSSGRNFAKITDPVSEVRYRSGNWGKGRTDVQARTSALCESLERYCMNFPENSYAITGSLEAIVDAIHPNDCMGFSEFQISNRIELNRNSIFNTVPNEFDPGKEIQWTPVFSLSNKKFKYLPTEFCFANVPSQENESVFCFADSNGCAAGNTIEEAILQGFLELVERDAAAIWWYNQLQRPGIDLRTAENSFVDKWVEYHELNGRSLHVIDITTDAAIPVFVAIAQNVDPNSNPEVLYSFGAHFDAGIALERAISELNQLLPCTEKDENGYIAKDPRFRNWLENIRLKDMPYLNPAVGTLKSIKGDFPSSVSPSLVNGVQACIDTAARLGLEILVLDMTQPDIGLPVVKVIVPGLRHFWRRTAPGRLYEVPVEMGWQDFRLQEHELNPFDILI